MSDDRDDEVDFEVGEEGAADYADASSMADAEAPAEPDAFDDDEFDRISGATPSPISPRRDDDAEMEAAEPPPPPPPRPRPEPRRRRQDDAPPQDWAPPEPARTERSERSERPEPSRVEPRFADRGFDRGPAPLPRPERMDQSKVYTPDSATWPTPHGLLRPAPPLPACCRTRCSWRMDLLPPDRKRTWVSVCV
ncbi:hypothetical protein DFJ74DRAFT_138287 [Hyaloraphidium curvatum]|nr:hypothetical protein DFJ74DRAFT_138287 [Hyaloraphidium curvatum]